MKLGSNSGRYAGFLYLLVVLIGAFQLLYVPSVVFVHDNAAATSNNIAAHEWLFRFGTFAGLWSGILMLFLALALYQLFKEVDRKLAALMVILGGVLLVAVGFNILTDAGALMLARGDDFLTVFGKSQRDTLMLLFLRLNTQQMYADEIFWGLWLFPLGMLVWKSRMLPRWLGIWLIINGGAYIVESSIGLLLPRFEGVVSKILFPVQLGEVAFMLWLLIMGIKQPQPLLPDTAKLQKEHA